MTLTIPFTISGGALQRKTSTISSIQSHINLLLTTSMGECVADPEFGFVFNNLRFEMFNENEGVVFSPEGQEDSPLYNKKIAGSSKNIHTFATQLKEQIERYEKRLTDVSVVMSYVREQRRVFVTVNALIESTKQPFIYKRSMVVWS